MNDVYVARNGDEWPETYVPYNASQVWIARNQVGTNGGVMTDGSSTNSMINNAPFQYGTAYIMGSSWGYGGNNTDAISFNLTNNWGHTGTYRITHWGIGALGTTSTSTTNSSEIVIQIVSGTNTNGSGNWYYSMPAGTNSFYGSNYTGYQGNQAIWLPAQDTYGNTMSLQFNTWYTILIGWVGPWTNVWTYQCNSTYYPSRTIAHPSGLGNLTMTWQSATFSGSGWRATSNGTSQTGGQHSIFGILTYTILY